MSEGDIHEVRKEEIQTGGVIGEDIAKMMDTKDGPFIVAGYMDRNHELDFNNEQLTYKEKLTHLVGRKLNKFFNGNVNMSKAIIGTRVLLSVGKVEAAYGKELAFTR